MSDKLRERDPFLWGLIALILGVTPALLWHWHLS
jgi:hypothetical protein